MYFVRVMTARANTPNSAELRFDSPEQELFLNLWRTYDRLRMLEDELFRRFDLTPQQYNVLRLLGAVFPRSIPTLVLAERLVSRAPDISRMLDKLEKRGCVLRSRPPENRRQVLVSLAPGGQELLAEIAEPLRSCHQKQLGHLSADTQRRLIELLQAARRPHEPAGSCWQ